MADSPQTSPTTQERTLEREGCKLHFTLRGPAAGTPVLFIQGVGVHGEGWRPQTEILSDRYLCLSFDNRGMAKSQPLPDKTKLTVEQMSADAIAIMYAQNWPSAHLVGHSLGGLIAQDIALRFRPRVRSLALLCTFSRGKDVTAMTPHMLLLGIRMRLGPRKWRRRAFLTLVMPPAVVAQSNPEALAEALAPLFGHDLADQPPIVMKQLNAMSQYDATPRLHELAGIPILVASALHDQIARPEYGQRIVEKIPGAKFVEFPDASHGLSLQSPAEINALLRDHIDRAESQRS